MIWLRCFTPDDLLVFITGRYALKTPSIDVWIANDWHHRGPR